MNHKAKRYCTFICNFSDRFLDVLTLKLKIIFILLNNQPERVQLTAHIAKIKLPLLSLIRNYSEFRTKLYFKKHGPVLKENLIWCKLACVWQNYWELFRLHVWHYLVFIILFICYIHVIVIYIHKHIYIYTYNMFYSIWVETLAKTQHLLISFTQRLLQGRRIYRFISICLWVMFTTGKFYPI